MTDPIRFGVIGAGGRAGGFIHTLMRSKERLGDLIALCDVNKEILEEHRKNTENALHHPCATYTDYHKLLENPDIDAVIIATPDQFHHEMAVAAFKAKKHVFCEKPVGTNLDQMIDIVRAAKSSGKILEIGYVLRYSPFYIEMKKMIDSGELGRPLFASAREQYYGGAGVFYRGWWRLRKNVGGVMVQKICHDMDLHYWMFGKPKKVVAFESNMEFKPGNWDSKATYCSECKNHCPYYTKATKYNKTNQCLYNTDKTGADISDNAQVLVQFESGLNLSMGMNFFNSVGQDDRHWQIIGSKGEITGRLSDQILRFDPRHDFSRSQSVLLECAAGGLGGHGGGDEVQLIEYMKGIHAGHEAKAGLESAYWSSIIVMSAQLSADTGQVINIPDLVKKYPFPE